MHRNFANLSATLKVKANYLVLNFNFPVTLPEFYDPGDGVIRNLDMMVKNARDKF